MHVRPGLLPVALAAGLTPLYPSHAAAADAVQLDTVQVKEQRRAASASQRVTVMDAAQMADELAENMEDLVRYIPGVSIADLGRFGDNGFNIRGMEGDRVGMVVDGLALGEGLETARSYEFFRAGRGGVDIDTLKQVEVIKGADAISAGSGALGGAVVFTTKDPSDYLSASGDDGFASVKLGYSGYNDEALGSVSLANRRGRLESMVVYTARRAHEAEGWYDRTTTAIGSARRLPDPVGHDSDNVLAKLAFVASPQHRWGVVYERNDIDNLVENLSRLSPPAYLQRWGDDHQRRERYGASYQWDGQTGAFDTLQAQVDRQRNRSVGLTRIVAGSGCPGAVAPCLRTEDRSSEQTLDRVAVDMDKAFTAGHTAHVWRYGGAWQQREVDFHAVDTRWNAAGAVTSVEVDPAQVPRTDVDNWTAYARDRMSWADDRIALTLGARYDRYAYRPRLSDTFKDATGTVGNVRFAAPTWQAALSYTVAPNHQLLLQAGRGFRAPTAGEMYAPTSTTTITEVASGASVKVPTSAANPDLDAERSLNLELGWRWQGERARLGVSVFRDRYDHYIQTVRITENPGTLYRSCSGTRCTTAAGYTYSRMDNVGEVTVKGVEAEGLWQLGQDWLVRAAWSHNQGDKRDGRPLNSINPDRLVTGVSWQAPGNRVRLTANLTHGWAKSRGDVDREVDVYGQPVEPFYSDAYTVVDLFGSVQLNDHLRINAGIYNLFDERWYQWSRIRDVTRGDFYLYGYATEEGIGRFSEPGRNARINVTYVF